ncbi:MAG: pilin [Salinicola sp.]|nr:pilin [Salinicola sp.]
MQQNPKSPTRRQGGFTLIELMIVVAIIGILAAIAIPQYQNYVARSEFTSALATLKGLQTPAELAIQEGKFDSTDLTKIGLSSAAVQNGAVTATAPDDANGVTTGDYTLVFTFSGEGNFANNSTITLTRDGDNGGGWACSTAHISTDVVPESCQPNS